MQKSKWWNEIGKRSRRLGLVLHLSLILLNAALPATAYGPEWRCIREERSRPFFLISRTPFKISNVQETEENLSKETIFSTHRNTLTRDVNAKVPIVILGHYIYKLVPPPISFMVLSCLQAWHFLHMMYRVRFMYIWCQDEQTVSPACHHGCCLHPRSRPWQILFKLKQRTNNKKFCIEHNVTWILLWEAICDIFGCPQTNTSTHWNM